MHKFKHLHHVMNENPHIGGNTQMWAYRGITAWYSKNNKFDLLEFDNTTPTTIINDYNSKSKLNAYSCHGQLLEGHIDYWFPVEQAQNCVVFAGYKNLTQYPNNVLSVGFDFFDFMVHEIFANPMFYNELNRAGVEQAEYDVCIPVGHDRLHRRIFLQCLADSQHNLKIVTDSRQTVLPTELTFDNLNMEPYPKKIGTDKFECHTTQQSFYQLRESIALMQMPHRLMHAACRVNVALETTVRQTNQPYLTEKTYKILAQARPFVIYGDTNTLQKLRSKGFQTFDKFCDESYDQETDCESRAKKAAEAVHQLVSACETHPEEIDIICRFNQQHYFDQQRMFDELADFGKLCLEKVFIGE
jgi:hypothetical protein